MNMKKFVNSFKYAFCGIKETVRQEQNLKIHLLMMILVIIAGIIFRINKIEWIICIILFGLVISAELFNTAIENVVDLITKEKDVAAGAVLVFAIASAIVGLIIFIPKVMNLIN